MQTSIVLTKILEVPLLLLPLEKLSMHEIVKALTTLQNIIHSRHDAEDAERKSPDTDHGDDVRSPAHKPSKDSKTSGEDIDNQDRAC